jgi:hypothetical protein
MKQYLLSIFHSEGARPAAAILDEAMRKVSALNGELRAADAWVFAGGLEPSSTATVVRLQDAEVLTTGGPFAEGKEPIGGCWIIQAADLDTALEWGRKATRACTLPVEVRAFQSEPGD